MTISNTEQLITRFSRLSEDTKDILNILDIKFGEDS
jgi:hypothetical protein